MATGNWATVQRPRAPQPCRLRGSRASSPSSAERRDRSRWEVMARSGGNGVWSGAAFSRLPPRWSPASPTSWQSPRGRGTRWPSTATAPSGAGARTRTGSWATGPSSIAWRRSEIAAPRASWRLPGAAASSRLPPMAASGRGVAAPTGSLVTVSRPRGPFPPISATGMAWRLSSPTLGVPAGCYSQVQQVTVSCSDPTVVVHYTLSGADPQSSDSVVPARAPCQSPRARRSRPAPGRPGRRRACRDRHLRLEAAPAGVVAAAGELCHPRPFQSPATHPE